jgi:hypothetical protein
MPKGKKNASPPANKSGHRAGGPAGDSTTGPGGKAGRSGNKGEKGGGKGTR